MPKSSKAERWTRTTLAGIAKQHFPSHERPLGEIVRRLADRHENAWLSSSEGVFRPTRAMYALALRWELEKVGPTCVFCKGKVEVPSRPAPSRPAGPTLALGFRVPPHEGGLNVPQNLAICHAGCLPGR